MFLQASLLKNHWQLSIAHVVHIINRLLSLLINNNTPYFILFNILIIILLNALDASLLLPLSSTIVLNLTLDLKNVFSWDIEKAPKVLFNMIWLLPIFFMNAQFFSPKYFNTFSLVVKLTTVRILHVSASIKNWHQEQLDVNNVFLRGNINEEVLMTIPKRYHLPRSSSTTKVCKFNKNHYGLKQVSIHWYSNVTDILISLSTIIPILISLYLLDILLRILLIF